MRDRRGQCVSTAPERIAPTAASASRGARLRRAGARGGQGREVRRHRGGGVYRLAPLGGAHGGGPRGRRRGLLHRLLRPGAEGGELPRPGRDSARPGRRGPRPGRRGRRLPSRRPAGRPQLRRSLPRLRASQRARHAARLRGLGWGWGHPRRPRLVLVDLRRGRDVPDPGGHASAADLAVRDHEARVRAPRTRVRGELRSRRRRPAVLHRLRPAAAAGHGARAHRRGARGRHALRAVRRRLAVAELHVRRRRGGRDDRGD